MDQKQKDTLRKHMAFLTDDIKLNQIFFEKLMEEGLASKSLLQDIKDTKVDKDWINRLLNNLMTRGEQTFGKLIRVLKSSQNGELAALLMEAEKLRDDGVDMIKLERRCEEYLKRVLNRLWYPSISESTREMLNQHLVLKADYLAVIEMKRNSVDRALESQYKMRILERKLKAVTGEVAVRDLQLRGTEGELLKKQDELDRLEREQAEEAARNKDLSKVSVDGVQEIEDLQRRVVTLQKQKEHLQGKMQTELAARDAKINELLELNYAKDFEVMEVTKKLENKQGQLAEKMFAQPKPMIKRPFAPRDEDLLSPIEMMAEGHHIGSHRVDASQEDTTGLSPRSDRTVTKGPLPPGVAKTPTPRPALTVRDQNYVDEINKLKSRIAELQNEVKAVKRKNTNLETKLNTLGNSSPPPDRTRQHHDVIGESEEGDELERVRERLKESKKQLGELRQKHKLECDVLKQKLDAKEKLTNELQNQLTQLRSDAESKRDHDKRSSDEKRENELTTRVNNLNEIVDVLMDVNKQLEQHTDTDESDNMGRSLASPMQHTEKLKRNVHRVINKLTQAEKKLSQLRKLEKNLKKQLDTDENGMTHEEIIDQVERLQKKQRELARTKEKLSRNSERSLSSRQLKTVNQKLRIDNKKLQARLAAATIDRDAAKSSYDALKRQWMEVLEREGADSRTPPIGDSRSNPGRDATFTSDRHDDELPQIRSKPPGSRKHSTESQQKQHCRQCGSEYRREENSSSACRYHPEPYRAVSGDADGGKRWLCCFKTQRSARGCRSGRHRSRSPSPPSSARDSSP